MAASSKIRRVLREYVKQYEGKEAVSFVKLERDFYSTILITLDSKSKEERTYIDFEKVLHFAVNNIENLKL